jgi:aubergine-like protein
VEENKKLSRAQKRRNAKRKEAEDAAASTPSPQPDTTTPPKVVTPEKAAKVEGDSTTPPKQTAQTKVDEQQKLTQQFSDLKVGEDEPAFRPLSPNEVCDRMGLGTSGKNTELISNTFQLNFLPTQVHRYVVEFEPEIPPERIKQRFITLGKFKQEITAEYGQQFFDGTNMLTLKKAGNSNFGPSADGCSIHIRFTRTVDTTNKHAQEVNMITNVMTKKLLRRQKMILIGRSYFYDVPKALNVSYHQSTPQNERYRLRLYTGFNVSVQPCLLGNLMTVDLVSRVVQELSVRNIMNNIMGEVKTHGGGREAFQERSKMILVGSTVLCTYNQRPWRIDDIDFTKTMASTFTIEADTRPPRPGQAARAPPARGNLGNFVGDISFQEYFLRRYPEIQAGNKLPPVGHPATKSPGLLVNIPKRERTTKQTTVLLPELCFLTGLDDKMRSNQSLMKALNNETRLPPSRRVKAISDLLRKVHAKTAEVDAKEGRLPVELSGTPVQIPGRVLTDVVISLPKSKKKLTDNKSFSNDIRACGFFGGRATAGDWGCVFPSTEARTAQTVVATMRQLAGQQGAVLGTCTTVEVPAAKMRDSKQWVNAVQEILTKGKDVKFILIMNPGADSFVYSVVKNACTVQNSVVSQVMDSTKLAQNQKMLKPICGNTLKQIMAKLGFQNWRVEIGRFLPPSEAKSTMFIGVDVSHDKLLKGVFGGSRGRRSTVGFTASRNDSHHAFNSYISYQDPDTEFITESKRLMTSALRDYAAENKGNFPTSIVIYRDGVGDSQLTTFVRSEIQLYKDAFSELNIRPKLSVIVVQKRVNLRLFASCPLNRRQATKCPIEDRCNGRDEYHSPMAGTCVDNVITSAMLSDFYLVPSIAPPGATARPTRFIVLKDEVGLAENPDHLQNMTNNMCYQYFNWPGPIRVPACVMYAHKAAYLFGKHVTGNPHAGLSKNLFYL